jgi:hypothetical protein
MTDPGYRHYLLIVDRSGSMTTIADEANHGIKHYLTEQATLPGKATLSLYQFDNIIERVHDFAPLHAGYQLVPRNMTALLDACGKAITETGEKLAALPENQRPGRVFVLITTDGLENASREWTREQVRSLIKRQREEYSWEFSYVGADDQAFEEGQSIGIPASAILHYSPTSHGTAGAYASASSGSVRSYVTNTPVSYTQQERDAAEEK